jgi:hypothetical protein
MSHHETPQKRERLQKLQNLHSPLTPPYLSPLLETSTKKETMPEAERNDLAVK